MRSRLGRYSRSPISAVRTTSTRGVSGSTITDDYRLIIELVNRPSPETAPITPVGGSVVTRSVRGARFELLGTLRTPDEVTVLRPIDGAPSASSPTDITSELGVLLGPEAPGESEAQDETPPVRDVFLVKEVLLRTDKLE